MKSNGSAITAKSIALLGLVVAGCCGCTSWKDNQLDLQSLFAKTETVESRSSDAESAPASVQQPAKVVAIWKDATLQPRTSKAVRGFSGRVYWFDANDQPIQVDGELIVYGFDDSSDFRAREQADKKFVIRAEDLKRKHSVSKIGSSYSIWLPWDEVGNCRKEITLVPMFRGTDGQVLRGEATKNLLPGQKSEILSEKEEFLKHFRETSRNGVTQATYEIDELATERVSNAPNKMQSTSITLPEGMSKRMGLEVLREANKPVQQTATEITLRSTSEESPGAQPISAVDSLKLTPAIRDARRANRYQTIPIKPIRSE